MDVAGEDAARSVSSASRGSLPGATSPPSASAFLPAFATPTA